LPSLRAAFAWLPPQERGELAEQVLVLHDATRLSRRVLTQQFAAGMAAEQLAAAHALETRALAALQAWGIATELDGTGPSI
ncbi:MAG TPA: hypothetical protein VE084_19420, partial [Burkholderiaceae bacterium]|nr:hypothetical protein [Burkholderiaceae bacterium]